MKFWKNRYVYSPCSHKNQVMESLTYSFPVLKQAQHFSVIYMVSFGENFYELNYYYIT